MVADRVLAETWDMGIHQTGFILKRSRSANNEANHDSCLSLS
jgi:hypothetical protein